MEVRDADELGVGVGRLGLDLHEKGNISRIEPMNTPKNQELIINDLRECSWAGLRLRAGNGLRVGSSEIGEDWKTIKIRLFSLAFGDKVLSRFG
jgi:hypothetical protein